LRESVSENSGLRPSHAETLEALGAREALASRRDRVVTSVAFTETVLDDPRPAADRGAGIADEEIHQITSF